MNKDFRNIFLGVFVGVILYKAVVEKIYNTTSLQANETPTVEPPSNRALIGQIRKGINENNWSQYQDWVSSSESNAMLRTLTNSDLAYLASVFSKQPCGLEPKAVEVLNKIGI